MTAATAIVVRDGERRVVPAAELVPGDLLVHRGGRRRCPPTRGCSSRSRCRRARRRSPARVRRSRRSTRRCRQHPRSPTGRTWCSPGRRRLRPRPAVVTATGMRHGDRTHRGAAARDDARADAAAAGARPARPHPRHRRHRDRGRRRRDDPRARAGAARLRRSSACCCTPCRSPCRRCPRASPR